MKRRQLIIIVACAMAMCAVSSCSLKQKVSDAECEELFTMPYGNADNELNIFDAASGSDIQRSEGQIRLFHTMMDGFFYVASQGKVAELNSYGALMYVCTSPDTASGQMQTAKEMSGARRSFKYPIIDVNGIAVDTKKHVYVACAMPEEERKTAENGMVLSWVVLCISRDASLDDYIGQQGIGGAPFPYIRSVNTAKDDEVVVISQSTTGEGIQAWYYSSDGRAHGSVTVPLTLTVAEKDAAGKKDKSIKCHVRDVLPDKQSRAVLICADTYDGQEYAKTYIIKADVKSGNYAKTIEIPPYQRIVSEDFGKVSYKMPYDFLGVSDNGDMFFAIATDDGFAVEIVSGDGRHVKCRLLHTDRKGCVYHTLSVSDSGIISAMMAGKDNASFMWWRMGDRN